MGVALGAIPSLILGSVSGALIVAFLFRYERVALFLSLNVGTFAIGVFAAFALTLLLCAIILLGKFAPNAAEFKRVNQEASY